MNEFDPHPPHFSVAPQTKTHRFRFTCGTTGTYAVTRAGLCNLLQYNIVAAGGANSYVSPIGGIRLKRVQTWGVVPALGSAANSTTIQWNGLYGPDLQEGDSSSGIQPAHLDMVPPPNSNAKWWSQNGQSGTEVLFTIITTAQDTIDIVVEFFLHTEVASRNFGDGTGAGTLGFIYGGYLDGYASKHLVPFGLNSLS